jgi:uncharacterized protein YjdB
VHTLRRIIAVIVAAVAWSCGGAITGVDRAGSDVAAVTIAPSSFTLTLGSETPLQATVRDGSGRILADVPVVWSVKDSSIARVSPTGVVSGRGVGSTQVAASAGGMSAIAAVTVQPPPVASVLVQPLTQSLVVGGSATFSATPRDVNGTTLSGRVVSWSSSNDAVATVSQSGEVSARGAGMATITATSEGVSGAATVTVSQPPVASVGITPANASLVVGATTTLVATLTDGSGATITGRAVSWSSSAPEVATVSASGVVTAVAPGSATITGTSEGAIGTATVVVGLVPVGSVEVQPANASVVAGQTEALSATVRDTVGRVVTDRVVSWTSSDTHVAVVSTAGVVTGVSAGTATITATSEGRSGSSTITVVAPAIASVTVQPSSATVQVGGTTTLTATVKDVTGAIVTDRAVTWASSNVAVATVSSNGVVTGRAAGTAVISATSGGRSGSVTVTVVLVPVGSVTVSPSSVTLVPTQVLSLSAEVRDANNVVVTDRSVTWTSSNAAVATVTTTGVVTAVAPGTATITATSEGKTGAATISVVPMPVGSVTVSPATANVSVGQTTTLSATVRDTSGAVVVDRTVTWRSSNTAIATVSSAGVVTGVAQGTVTVTATSETRSGSAAVTVQPVPVATVTLDPTSVTLEPGQTATLVATTKSADGTVLTGRAVTYTSDNVNVARVSSDGVVTGVAPGAATITATSEGKTATATVTVQPMVAYVVVSPNEVSVRRNNTVQLSATAYDASNNVVVGRTVTWTSGDDHLATVSDTGLVTARRTGTVTITATIDGRSGTAQVRITN